MACLFIAPYMPKYELTNFVAPTASEMGVKWPKDNVSKKQKKELDIHTLMYGSAESNPSNLNNKFGHEFIRQLTIPVGGGKTIKSKTLAKSLGQDHEEGDQFAKDVHGFYRLAVFYEANNRSYDARKCRMGYKSLSKIKQSYEEYKVGLLTDEINLQKSKAESIILACQESIAEMLPQQGDFSIIDVLRAAYKILKAFGPMESTSLSNGDVVRQIPIQKDGKEVAHVKYGGREYCLTRL